MSENKIIYGKNELKLDTIYANIEKPSQIIVYQHQQKLENIFFFFTVLCNYYFDDNDGLYVKKLQRMVQHLYNKYEEMYKNIDESSINSFIGNLDANDGQLFKEYRSFTINTKNLIELKNNVPLFIYGIVFKGILHFSEKLNNHKLKWCECGRFVLGEDFVCRKGVGNQHVLKNDYNVLRLRWNQHVPSFFHLPTFSEVDEEELERRQKIQNDVDAMLNFEEEHEVEIPASHFQTAGARTLKESADLEAVKTSLLTSKGGVAADKERLRQLQKPSSSQQVAINAYLAKYVRWNLLINPNDQLELRNRVTSFFTSTEKPTPAKLTTLLQKSRFAPSVQFYCQGARKRFANEALDEEVIHVDVAPPPPPPPPPVKPSVVITPSSSSSKSSPPKQIIVEKEKEKDVKRRKKAVDEFEGMAVNKICKEKGRKPYERYEPYLSSFFSEFYVPLLFKFGDNLTCKPCETEHGGYEMIVTYRKIFLIEFMSEENAKRFNAKWVVFLISENAETKEKQMLKKIGKFNNEDVMRKVLDASFDSFSSPLTSSVEVNSVEEDIHYDWMKPEETHEVIEKPAEVIYNSINNNNMNQTEEFDGILGIPMNGTISYDDILKGNATYNMMTMQDQDEFGYLGNEEQGIDSSLYGNPTEVEFYS